MSVEADHIVCTHSHPDHFDYDAIPVLARKPSIHFTAAPDCRAEFQGAASSGKTSPPRSDIRLC